MAPLTVEKTRLLFGPYTLAVEVVGWYDEIPFLTSRDQRMLDLLPEYKNGLKCKPKIV